MNKPHIKNISNFRTLVNLPNARFRREFRPGQDIPVSEEVLEEFNYDAGCTTLVKLGYLKAFPAEDTATLVPMEKADGKTAEDVNVDALLTTAEIKDLSEALKNGTPALKDSVVQRAIELEVVDTPRCNVIKHFTGVDVLEALAMARKE